MYKNNLLTDNKEIANAIAEHFSYVSTSSSYSTKFQQFKTQAEKLPINFNSDNSEYYNTPFSLASLYQALNKLPQDQTRYIIRCSNIYQKILYECF